MATEESLPPPKTSLAAEIYFRRMLASLEHRISEVQETVRSEGDVISAIPFHPELAKLKTCVDSLQDAISDLERNCAKDVGGEALVLYKQRVKLIAANLPPLNGIPPYCRKPVPRTKPPPPIPGSTSKTAGGSGGTSTATGRQLDEFTGGVSDATRDKMQQQEQIQEELTSELVDMAAQLKQGTQGLSHAVRRRGHLTDETETSLVKSVENAKSVAAKAKQQHKRGGGTFWLTIFVLFTVVTVFACMIFYINFTSVFLGYRARRVASIASKTTAGSTYREWEETHNDF